MEILKHPIDNTECSLTVFCRIILTIATAIISALASAINNQHQVIINPGNYEQAARTCGVLHGSGWDLPAPNKDIALVELMESHSLSSVWTRLKRRDFSEWTNLDNTTFDGRVQTYGDPQKTCVLLKVGYEALVSDTCLTSGYGYACQLNSCSIYPPSVSPSHFIVKNSKCYFIGCDVATWFHAVNLCKKMGAQLATFNTAYQLKEFISGIKSRSENACKHYWVGLRKTDWYFRDKDGDSLPDHYQWHSDNPSPEDDCAVLKKYTSGYYWQSVNCTEKHETICVRGSENDITSDRFETGTTVELKITRESLEQQTQASVGSEGLQTAKKFIGDTTTKEWISVGQYWKRGTDGRIDFIVVMWSFILVTVVVYITYLMIQRRSKLKESFNCFQRNCGQQIAMNFTSAREQDAGGTNNWEQQQLMDRKSTLVGNGLRVLNPPASTLEMKVQSPCQVGGSTHSDTDFVHINPCSPKMCTI